MLAASARPAAAPFPIDVDALQALASEPIIRRGIAYFRENRVMELNAGADHIHALVEGSIPGAPYEVELGIDEDGELLADCSCPFDWEPVCKHMVASLMAYGAQLPAADAQVESAADEAVEARARRGRSEVRVELVEGEPTFGVWHARSLLSASGSGRTWRVQMRSTEERINHCTCPDFAVNALGTCKHIEAVLHKLRKGRKKRAAPGATTRGTFVHLAWDGPQAPEIAIHLGAEVSPEQRALIDRHFNRDGHLKGPALRAFFPFVDEAVGSGIQIGDDARAYAQRLAEDAARRTDAERIRAQILSGGGQIASVRARLYPYQVEGVAFLASTGRALLADDMGLGKTLQAIAAAAWLAANRGMERALVVCPASLKHQWAREIRRFTGLDVEIIHGNAAARQTLYRRRAPFTVANYEVVRGDHEVIQKELAPDLLILDEAQRIKNWKTKLAAAIKALDTTWAFVLSGTPLENRLEDLYSLMQVVDPRVLGPLWRYLIDFHVLDERGKVLGYRNLSELRRRLKPVMLRRDRRVVRDQLPERLDLRLDLPLDKRQKALHDEAVDGAARLGNIAQRRPLTPSEEKMLLSLLQRARMACDAAGLVDKETKGSPKLDELSRLIDELCIQGGLKVVVFSQWERMTAMAEEAVRALGVGSVRLHGGIPTAKRGALIDRFREDPEVQVFLSTDAGGVGLNLQVAGALVNLDVPWNPAVLEQRIARIHRLGQGRPVQVIQLIAEEGYEARVAALVATKQQLFDGVVDPDSDEEVVGVSKKSIELMLEALKGEEPDAPAPPTGEVLPLGVADLQEPPSGDGEPPVEAQIGRPPRPESAEDRALREGLAALQARLGTRVERVLATAGGLVVVVDVADAEARDAVEACLTALPAVAMDAATVASLSRFSSGPLAGAEALYTRPDASEESASALGAFVKRKLRAAEALISQGCAEDGVEALADTMVASVAARSGQAGAPPTAAAASVWLYTEALPRGLVTADEALAIGRAVSLRQTAELPPALLHEMLADARRLAAPWASAG